MNGEIELEIGGGSGAGQYDVRVLRSAAGGEPAGTLELDVDEVLGQRDLLEATVLASGVTRRSVPAEQPVRQVGRQLFEALFTGPVYGTYRASLGIALQQGKRLRVVLRLTAPELAALPWEMLFDPETETYLCRQEPLVRHVPAPYTAEPLQVRPPIRILGLAASPRDKQALDVDAEKSHLAEALARPMAEGLIEVVWAPEATWPGVQDLLLAGEWHVLHFVGHGDYDTSTDEGVLAFVGADGRADLVDAGRLADLLGEAQPTPRLVVLNSCSSGRSGMNDLFSGTAAALAHRGISAVAAMQFTISDTAAIAFARGFYTAIAHGRSVDEAARSGRISILGAPGSLEWATPVLYVRGPASQLFTVTAPPPAGVAAGDEAAAGSLRDTARHARELATQPTEPLQRINFYPDCVLALAWRPDGRCIAVTGTGSYTVVYDISGGEAKEQLKVKSSTLLSSTNDVAFSPDGTRLATCASRHAQVWYAASGRQLLQVRHGATVRAVAFSPDGTRLATGSFDNTARIWDTASRQQVLQVRHGATVYAVAFSPDGTRLATGSSDNTARIWDTASRQQVLQVRHDATVRAAAFSPDGTRLATGSFDGTARIWDTASGRQLLQVRHDGEVCAVAFSPDGTRLATGGADNTARIWDAASGQQLLQVRHDAAVRAVAFSPDGTRLATGSDDKSARIWLVPEP